MKEYFMHLFSAQHFANLLTIYGVLYVFVFSWIILTIIGRVDQILYLVYKQKKWQLLVMESMDKEQIKSKVNEVI